MRTGWPGRGDGRLLPRGMLMSVQCEVAARQAEGAPLGFFERWLTLWVGLCIVAGIALGHWLPAPF